MHRRQNDHLRPYPAGNPPAAGSLFWRWAYNALLHGLLVGALPAVLPLVVSREKRRRTVAGRLGWPPGGPRPAEAPIWVHALSVGEVISAVPLLHALCERLPGVPLVASASTLTGHRMAARRFKDMVSGLEYFPYDFLFSVRAAYRRIRPRAVVLVESDIWPNHVHEAGGRGVPIFLVNARLSSRSAEGYRRWRGLFGPVWQGFSAICCQSVEDARRFRQAGADSRRLHVSGNLKFDQTAPVVTETDAAALRAAIGWTPGRRVILAGSTHDGEERWLLEAAGTLRRDHGALLLVLAPRDPHRATAIKQLCRGMGMRCEGVSRMAAGSGGPDVDVAVVDGIGLLGRLYAVADVAFVGGSLVPGGGHNPLEPAAFGKPVLFGPDMRDFAAIGDLLRQSGGARRVDAPGDLAPAVDALLRDPEAARRMGRAALAVHRRHRGAAGRIADVMAPLIVGDGRGGLP